MGTSGTVDFLHHSNTDTPDSDFLDANITACV